MLETVRGWYRSTFGHALLAAALLWLALPPADLWPLAWAAPLAWVLLVRRGELSGKRPYLKIWVAGFLFWMAALHWLCLPHWLTSFGWVAVSFYLAFYLPAFVGLSRVAVHRLRVPVILAAPVVWTGLELLRGHLLTGFTMASLGHTQYRWIELIQISDLAGAYGVGFVVMLVAACLARAVPIDGKSWTFWPLLPAAGVLCATLAYGHVRMAGEHDGPQARVALIQGSIDIVLVAPPGTHERMHKQYRGLSEKAVARYEDLDLIIWPETVFHPALVDYVPMAPVPDDWPHSEEEFRRSVEVRAAESRRAMRQLADELGTPLLVGVTTYYLDVDGPQHFNSAAFVPLGDAPIERYDKMHRVMFGEYVPFADRLAWLVRLTPLSTLGTGVTAGTEPAGFSLDGLRVAPSICYENVMPHLIRRQVNTLDRRGREPDVLVNLTNDGWFWGSSELDMHLVCGVFRAVECRKPMLIAANTGFSAWIDGDGRILARGPRRATDVVLAEVAADTRNSWYLAHGDRPAGLCLVACLVFATVGVGRWVGGRRRSRQAKPESIPTKKGGGRGGRRTHKQGGWLWSPRGGVARSDRIHAAPPAVAGILDPALAPEAGNPRRAPLSFAQFSQIGLTVGIMIDIGKLAELY